VKANGRGGWGVRAVTRPVNQLPPTNLGHTLFAHVKCYRVLYLALTEHH